MMEGRTSFLIGVAIAIVTVLQGCGGGESPAPVPSPAQAPTPAPGPPTPAPSTTPAPPTQPPKRSSPKGKGVGVYVYDHVNDAGASFKLYTGSPTLGGWVKRPNNQRSPNRDWDINDLQSFNQHGDSAHGGLKVPGAGEMVVEWNNGKICTLTFSSDGRNEGICEASSDCGNNAAGVPAVHATVDAANCASVVFSLNVVPDPNAGPATPAPPAPPAPPTSPPAPSGAGIGVFVWNHLHNDQGVTFKLRTGAPSTGSWVSRPVIPRDWGIKDTREFDKLNEGAHGGLAVPGAGTMQVEWSTGKTCTLTYSSDGKADGACSASTDCGKNAAGRNVFSAVVDPTTCESIVFSADVAPPVAALAV